MRRLLTPLLLILSCLFSGCATSQLWSDETLLITSGKGDGPVEFAGVMTRCYRNADGSLAYPGEMTLCTNGKTTVVSGFLIVPAEEAKMWKWALCTYAPVITARQKVMFSDFFSGYPLANQYRKAASFAFIETENIPTGYLREDDSNSSEDTECKRFDARIAEKDGPFHIVYHPVGRTPGTDRWNTIVKVVATPASVAADTISISAISGACVILAPAFFIGTAVKHMKE